MKKVILPLTLIVIGLFSILLFQLFGAGIVSTVLKWDVIKKFQELPIIESVKREVNLPGGLRSERNDPNAYLTTGGVIEWTNRHRAEDGLTPLRENALLAASAQKKLEDMFQKQYFAHDSPDGISPGQVIESVGYEYITTGENLALGNFANDQELVQAWMDSPGHRANILKDRYEEIGIAVGKGIFDGQEVWISVQHFGKPYASCPLVDDSMKQQIDTGIADGERMKQELDRLKQEIDNADPQTLEEIDAHNEKVKRHNELVQEYNSKIEHVKSLTENYNSQVRAFNACADSGE